MTRSDLISKIGGRPVVLSVSGGKDSAAASLYLREQGIEHIRVFADTGWEHPRTYEYLRGPLTATLGPIVEVRREVNDSPQLFTDLVRGKRIFPDRTKRFCTVMLKVEPIGAYLASLDCDVVNAIGIRRAESQARSEVPEWDYSPRLDCDVWRPIASWSLSNVIDIHKRHGLTPNPLYAMGATRVGCWPCIHARQSEILLVADTDPERVEEIRALEEEITESARTRAESKGEKLDWIRSLFSLREGKATFDGYREATQDEIADGATPGLTIPVMRRKHRPMQIDEAVRWARAGRARKEREEIPSGCGEWGFCEIDSSEHR